MIRNRRPGGHESVVAEATLEKLEAKDARERELAGLTAFMPEAARWRDSPRAAIRLINLERRARFSRFAFEAN